MEGSVGLPEAQNFLHNSVPAGVLLASGFFGVLIVMEAFQHGDKGRRIGGASGAPHIV